MGAAFCSRLGSRGWLLLGAAAEALLLGAQPRLGERRLPAYGSISLPLPAALAQSGIERALAHLPSVRGTFFIFLRFVPDPRASEGPGRGLRRSRGGRRSSHLAQNNRLAPSILTGLGRPLWPAEGLRVQPRPQKVRPAQKTRASDAASGRNVEGGPGALWVNKRARASGTSCCASSRQRRLS